VIAQMSDSDLAKQLKLLSLNEDIGPITPNTRSLYERRLMKYLILEQASSCTIPYTPPNTDLNDDKLKTLKCEDLCHTNGSVVDVPHGVRDDGDVHSSAADSGLFFGVQLQSDAPWSSGENSSNYCKMRHHTYCYNHKLCCELTDSLRIKYTWGLTNLFMPGFRNEGQTSIILRSEDIPWFILGLSFGILAVLSILGITVLGITRRCL